jgi:hypothetical protein
MRTVNPLQIPAVRYALGLLNAAVVLVVVFTVFDAGPERWAGVAVALVNAVTLPWILGRAARETAETPP